MAFCFLFSALITRNSDCFKCAIWLRSFLVLVTLSAVTKHAACTLCGLLDTFGTFWRLVLIIRHQSLAATRSALSGAFWALADDWRSLRSHQRVLGRCHSIDAVSSTRLLWDCSCGFFALFTLSEEFDRAPQECWLVCFGFLVRIQGNIVFYCFLWLRWRAYSSVYPAMDATFVLWSAFDQLCHQESGQVAFFSPKASWPWLTCTSRCYNMVDTPDDLRPAIRKYPLIGDGCFCPRWVGFLQGMCLQQCLRAQSLLKKKSMRLKLFQLACSSAKRELMYTYI